MPMATSRRAFLRDSLLAGASLVLTARRAAARAVSPNEKLNIGVIGVAHRGRDNLLEVSSQSIVALCDVDESYLADAAKSHPNAALYTDFRRLLDRRDLDAVVISTPDHTHAPAAAMALKAGLHVYCEKPLAHTVAEARIITELAARHKRVTQLGTQIHAGSNYRRVVELVRAGAIGPIRDVHVWCSASSYSGPRPTDTPPVPPQLHYDLWLGPAPYRPYNPAYLPGSWRSWWDFGNGALGDFGCHYMDLPFWALELRYPTKVAAEGPPVDPETTPPWLIVRYQFPAREALPPVALSWYHGGKKPDLPDLGDVLSWPNAVLFVGEKGMLAADYSRHALLPEKQFEGFQPPPPSIPDSIGHHNEWIQACKTGEPTTCNFGYSGPLTEAVLLGNVAYRVGRELEWDARHLRAINCREAHILIRKRYRSGWRL